MKRVQMNFSGDFSVLTGNIRAQAAIMVIPPGGSEGGSDNRHRASDQWLYVVAGKGLAIIGGKKESLGPGTLLLIEKGETHEIRNEGDAALETLNFYVPPAYAENGEPLSRDGL